jgi:hypothetical protein
MKKVTLLFPNASSLLNFVFQERFSGLDVKSSELTVSGLLTEKQVTLTCTKYEAQRVRLGHISS